MKILRAFLLLLFPLKVLASGGYLFNGLAPVTGGGTGTSTQFTQGSVVFAGANGVYTQSNSNFFWDATNNRLGIGTAAPGYILDIVGASGIQAQFGVAGTKAIIASNDSIDIVIGSLSNVPLDFKSNNTQAMTIDTSQRVGVGTTSPKATLDSSGTGSGAGVGINSMTSAQVAASTPLRAGVLLYNSSISKVCVSTGTTIMAYARDSDGTTCQ